MATIEEQIKSIEDEIQKTPYNKATQHHIGKLKAKVARLKSEQELRRLKSGGSGVSYAVKKSGSATVGLVVMHEMMNAEMTAKFGAAKHAKLAERQANWHGDALGSVLPTGVECLCTRVRLRVRARR